MKVNLKPSDVRQFISLVGEIDKVGGVYLRRIPDSVVDLFVLTELYQVSENAGYTDIVPKTLK